MRRREFLPLPLAAALGVLGFRSASVIAQDATPQASPAVQPVTMPGDVVASGLTNPRGFIWDDKGVLHVALAGSGGTVAATEKAPFQEILGVPMGGLTGAVVKIEGGCPVALATGLPSAGFPAGDVLGAEDLAILNGELYVSVDGGGATHGNPDHPSGVCKVNGDGTTTLVADLSAWLRANPAAKPPPDWDPDADGYRMLADETAGALWVVEPNFGGLLQVKPDGTITRIADLSDQHPVPAAIAPAPDGGVYLGMLTVAPFNDGAAKVIKVAPDGTFTELWSGLTMITGLAVAADGTLYAAEMSTGNLAQPPFLQPGSGKVVRMTGPAAMEEIASGLMFPIHLAIGPDGGLYIATPGIGASQGQGAIVRIGQVPGQGSPMTALTAVTCQPIPETLTKQAEVSPVASPTPL